MRRFASIDFLRGTAIFLMVFLHTFMFAYAYPGQDELMKMPLAVVLGLIVMNYSGGMAGFFLLVSAIGNQVSMQRNMEGGSSAKTLAIRQVVGGFVLLIFAALTEGVIGYHGALGDLIRLNPDWWQLALWREWHMETIHTIAWCVICNGIVQAILSMKDGWKKVKRNVIIYALLAIAVVAVTPLIWGGVSQLIPGYPYAPYPSDPSRWVQYPLEGVTPWYGYIYLFFLAPLAGTPEPIFPYLAISFVGSIVGILLSQPREHVRKDFPRKILYIGFIMLLVGTIGISVTYLDIMDKSNLGSAVTVFLNIWDHRYYGYGSLAQMYPAFWLFQFLALNGTGMCMTLLIIRLVEFRGKGQVFAKKTATVRRYGFVAFTVYNYQWFYFPMQLIISFFVYGTFSYTGLPGEWTIVLAGLTFLEFQVILLAWEKIRYAGSIEWCIGTISLALIPGKKQFTEGEGKANLKWWQKGLLNVKGAFYEPQWLNVVEENEIPHDQLKESRLAAKLAIGGFFVFPLSIIAYLIAKASIGTEKVNTYNKWAKILAIVGIIFAIAWITLCFFVNLNSLGI